jgi:hypothetical protein
MFSLSSEVSAIVVICYQNKQNTHSKAKYFSCSAKNTLEGSRFIDVENSNFKGKEEEPRAIKNTHDEKNFGGRKFFLVIEFCIEKLKIEYKKII